MATAQFNTRSPTIKRILRESRELSSQPSPDFSAGPLDTNLFEWHFTLRGPPSTPYANGLYHGRIVLPPSYPLRPPSFRFLTPSGRFEVNREICLSISGFHEESWQPAWGIRTALVAIRAFMEGDAKGQVGGVEASKEVRERYARESAPWRCSTCGKTNADIARDFAKEESRGQEEAVPEELKLGYKDELGKEKEKTAEQTAEAQPQTRTEVRQPADSVAITRSQEQGVTTQPLHAASPRDETAGVAHSPQLLPIQPTIHTSGGGAAAGHAPQPTRTVVPQAVIRPARRREDDVILNRLDMAIAVFAAALAYMIVKKIASWTA